MVAWGTECSSWDDSVDWANIEALDYLEIPDDKFVMTTWHANEPLSEALWFAKYNAYHPTINIEHTLLIHISTTSKKQAFLRAFDILKGTAGRLKIHIRVINKASIKRLCPGNRQHFSHCPVSKTTRTGSRILK